MKSPEPLGTPGEPIRSPYLPRLVEPEDEPEDRFQPRYVERPADGAQRHATRNLAWGVAVLLLAVTLLIVAILLAGAKAALTLAICLVTYTALFVLARLQVFGQRNGGFLGLAIVCLLGAIIPLIECSFTALDARTKEPAPATGQSVRLTNTEPPLLTESFALGQPDAKSRQLKVLKDSRVVIGEKAFLIRAGDVFPLVEASEHLVTFAVRDLQVSLPAEVVRVIDPKARPTAEPLPPTVRTSTAPAPAVNSNPPAPAPAPAALDPNSPEGLAQVTMSAQKEAIRRYPALAIADSLENKVFISTYKELKEAGSAEFFSNPEWPLELADLLAKREGWSKEGRPMTTGPAPMLEAPPAEEPVAQQPQ